MKLLHGTAIKDALRQVAPTSIAVAYVGIDWSAYVDVSHLTEVILSPTLGTNPSAVVEVASQLGWENVHFLDNLHSKIYLGAEQAAVGSFNLTSNGLSAKGLEEAGFLVRDPGEVLALRALFESYKLLALAAYPSTKAKLARLAVLRTLWDRAVKTGAIRNDALPIDFAAFRAVAPDEIYVSCVWGEIEYSDQVVSPASIKDSVSILESDQIQTDRWILCWYKRNDGLPDIRRKPYWFHIDELLSNGAIDAQYTKIAIERSDRCVLPPPFELTDPVVKALHAVLRSGRFPDFLGNVDPWSFNPTIPKLPAFFDAMRDEFHQSANVAGSEDNSIDSLRENFSKCVRQAMDIALRKKYVTSSIEGLLSTRHAVEVAILLVGPNSEMKSGLKKLAKFNALQLSFESLMLKKQFQPLFSKQDLECARFNLF
jgi:hypothetical protein